MTAQMLRVAPHPDVGDLPVPLEGGGSITRATTPEAGVLVTDSLFIRRRVAHRELVILAEGDAALPAQVETTESAP